MITLRLAYRNLVGAGLRTWLNVVVLSLSFVVIIWMQGLLEGWNKQARRDMIGWEVGGGQYWHKSYDPYDPFTIQESHGVPPQPLKAGIKKGFLTPILIAQATIYPEGRMRSVLLKGIEPEQKIVKIPSQYLRTNIEEIPAVIGTRMAKSTRLKKGDFVTVRWRDVSGTFDAEEAKIVYIMKTNVGTVDNGQMWVPLERLRKMMQMKGEATIIVADKNADVLNNTDGWVFKNQDYLLQEVTKLIKSKTAGSSVLYILLLFLAMLAIFDTQVFSIFHRRKEIGTLIALGMTRSQVIRLFTLEGAMHGVLAALVAAVYGIPLLTFFAVKGFAMPKVVDSYGLNIANRIFPSYSAGLILGTVVLVFVTVTIVSFIPTRRISKLKPTDAIRGKID